MLIAAPGSAAAAAAYAAAAAGTSRPALSRPALPRPALSRPDEAEVIVLAEVAEAGGPRRLVITGSTEAACLHAVFTLLRFLGRGAACGRGMARPGWA